MPKHASKKGPQQQQRRPQPYGRDKNTIKPNGQQLKAKPQQHARSLKAASALLNAVHQSSIMQLLQDTGAKLAEKGITTKQDKHGKNRAKQKQQQQQQQQQAMEAAPLQQPQQQPAAIFPPASTTAAAPAAQVHPAADINALLGSWSLKQPKDASAQEDTAGSSNKQGTTAPQQPPVAAGASANS
jgi:cobalamin-dependent methionine synthase I